MESREERLKKLMQVKQKQQEKMIYLQSRKKI